MAEQVVYEMSLKDLFSSKIQAAEHHAKVFEGTLHQIGRTALRVAETLGISFALFKGYEFVKEGVESMHQLHEAEAQVRAGLESTGEAAGVTYEELEASAKTLA